jgi:hypothetical protein
VSPPDALRVPNGLSLAVDVESPPGAQFWREAVAGMLASALRPA